MAKFLLDKFLKSKLNDLHIPYSEEGWANMNTMLDSAKNVGNIVKGGTSFGVKALVFSGVALTIIGTTWYFIGNNDDAKQIITQKPIAKNEIVVEPKLENKIEVASQPIQNKNARPKTKVKPYKNTINQIDSQISNVEEKIYEIDDHVVVVAETSVDNTIVQTPQTAQLEPKKETIIRTQDPPTPVPAKDVFKKKRRSIWSFFRFRKK